MPALTYLPPADIADFARSTAKEAELRAAWHRYIGDAINKEAKAGHLFYDAAHDPEPQNAPAVAPIPWNGFPRTIWEWFNAETDDAMRPRALASAETLRPLGFLVRPSNGERIEVSERQQDEYCEWHVDRDQNDRITRICFTSEGPEYWETMWDHDPDLVVKLYREFIHPDVQKEHLCWPEDMGGEDRVVITHEDENGHTVTSFPGGRYNKWNRWNTTLGVMHLTHSANTLGAEIKLAADATAMQGAVAEQPADTLAARLICCAGYGGVSRSSDPLIGKGVNDEARKGNCVTLQNPVGLYMQDIAIGSLRSATNQPIGPACLSIPRASADGKKILRAEIKPPAGAGYTLDQCKFEGQDLVFGGQIARRITMVLFGLSKKITGRTALAVPSCRKKCCTKPHSDFKTDTPPASACGSVDWNALAPFEPGAAPQAAGVQLASPTAAIVAALKGTRSRH